jgi:SAM-dependent methyltransferase
MNPILKIASGSLKDGQAVLEIGCGMGEFINELTQMRPDLGKIVAVDSYRRPDKLDSRIEFIQQKIEDLELHDRFDLVIMKHTFEHFKNPLGVIEKLRAVLNKNGKILIEVPNRKGFNNEARSYIPEHGKHYFLWDQESLEYSLERLGFRCRFYNLYRAGSRNIFLRYLPMLLRLQNANLVCLAMLDES